MPKNETETRVRLLEQAVKIINHNTSQINETINGKDGLKTKITQMETTMNNIRWWIPISITAIVTLIELASRLL